MKYSSFYKPLFAEDVKVYASMKKQIEKKTESIIENPYYNTELLEKKGNHDLRGLRSKRIDKNFRIIFAVCEECKRLFPEKEKPCRYCNLDIPEMSIIFFTVRPHKVVYNENKPLD